MLLVLSVYLVKVYAEAGDINWAADALDSKGVKTTQINAQDILHLKRHLLDIKYITQSLPLPPPSAPDTYSNISAL